MNSDPISHTPYFIGIALPSPLNEQVDALKWQLHKEIDNLLQPLVPHITLLHPPSLRGVDVTELLPKMREIIPAFLPLTLSLETIDAFDNTVLYIRARSPQLNDLQAELVKLLPPDAQEMYHQRGFIPHVTLAQSRTPQQLDIAALRNRALHDIPLPIHFTSESVSIFTRTAPRKYKSHGI